MVFSLNTRLFDPELSEAYVCIHGTFDWDVNSKLKIISVFVLREKVRQVYYYCDFFFLSSLLTASPMSYTIEQISILFTVIPNPKVWKKM